MMANQSGDVTVVVVVVVVSNVTIFSERFMVSMLHKVDLRCSYCPTRTAFI